MAMTYKEKMVTAGIVGLVCLTGVPGVVGAVGVAASGVFALYEYGKAHSKTKNATRTFFNWFRPKDDKDLGIADNLRVGAERVVQQLSDAPEKVKDNSTVRTVAKRAAIVTEAATDVVENASQGWGRKFRNFLSFGSHTTPTKPTRASADDVHHKKSSKRKQKT